MLSSRYLSRNRKFMYSFYPSREASPIFYFSFCMIENFLGARIRMCVVKEQTKRFGFQKYWNSKIKQAIIFVFSRLTIQVSRMDDNPVCWAMWSAGWVKDQFDGLTWSVLLTSVISHKYIQNNTNNKNK